MKAVFAAALVALALAALVPSPPAMAAESAARRFDCAATRPPPGRRARPLPHRSCPIAAAGPTMARQAAETILAGLAQSDPGASA